ncbi:RNA-binding domain-containing protein [Exidia glandulosa HHB12029]|uniref:RNA-binding domain-containing protein n=1 Tax=Exidia glandulosa HHB12029 TaxID=1314781 RepID=A0A165QKI0_EXIGL|nr:RNA-binding domain-containing protein [Exidia glandulosa HHB12029]
MASPSATLYVHNLNDKVKTGELRHQLFALFSTYGRLIDVVASKGTKMRGQAFLVFHDLAAATTAMRACEGMSFYDKPLRIEYARAKSHATIRQEDPNFVSQALASAKQKPGAVKTNGAEKRHRENDDASALPAAKRGKPAGDDGDEDEMEIEEDDDDQPARPAANGVAAVAPGLAPSAQRPPSATLLCTNLPQEITEDMLSVLFQQYQGFQSAQVTQSPHPAIVAGVQTNAKTKMAQVFYDSADLAILAKDALDGFTIKKGWKMVISYV